jgi:hypothetical protein
MRYVEEDVTQDERIGVALRNVGTFRVGVGLLGVLVVVRAVERHDALSLLQWRCLWITIL